VAVLLTRRPNQKWLIGLVLWPFVAKRAILDKATELLRDPVDDAVLIVRRKPFYWVATAASVIVVAMCLTLIDLPSLTAAAIGGAIAGGTQVLMVEYYFVARSPTRLALLASRTWIGRPTKLLRDINPSDVVELTTGWTTTKFQFGVQICHVSKIYLTRLRTILGR
jgi:hypothetical protein